MHPLLTRVFGDRRWRLHGGDRDYYGGLQVIDIKQSKRAAADTLAEIERTRAEHAATIDEFHRLFYGSSNTWGMTFYEGVPVLKNPMDLWVLQEIIWDLKPTLVVETGTAFGGSALYYARQLDRIGEEGKVLSIDIDPSEHLPQHERIHYWKGISSTRSDLVEAVGKVAASHPRVMVVLDSDHSKRHVLAELECYSPLVTQGQFLVVEDTNINGRPVAQDWKGGPGPGPAVDEWLPRHPEFERALMAERFLITHNPGGWLRRVS